MSEGPFKNWSLKPEIFVATETNTGEIVPGVSRVGKTITIDLNGLEVKQGDTLSFCPRTGIVTLIEKSDD